MDKNTFILEVQEEIDYLRNTITPKERDNLVADKFHHRYNQSCIYGLLKLHTKKKGKYCFATDLLIYEPIVPFEVHNFSIETNSKWIEYAKTALEKYLYMIERNNQLEILKYIKGEINEIDLYII